MRVTNHWLLTFSIPTYGADSKPAHKYERKPAMPNANRHGGTGQIRPHQRNANFTGTFLGKSLHLSEDQVAKLHATEQFTVETSTKRASTFSWESRK